MILYMWWYIHTADDNLGFSCNLGNRCGIISRDGCIDRVKTYIKKMWNGGTGPFLVHGETNQGVHPFDDIGSAICDDGIDPDSELEIHWTNEEGDQVACHFIMVSEIETILEEIT